MSDLRDGLRAEICFWCDLLESSEVKVKSKEYRRMEDALALARKRLTEIERQLVRGAAPYVEH